MTHYMEFAVLQTPDGRAEKKQMNIWFNDDESLDWFMETQMKPWISVRVYHDVRHYRGQAVVNGETKPIWCVYKDCKEYNRNRQPAPYIVVYEDKSFKATKCLTYRTRDLSVCWCFSRSGAEKIAKREGARAVPLLLLLEKDC